MSVAFLRESDKEHLEPKFELPIPPGPNLVTARGLALIGERVQALESAITAIAMQPDQEQAIVAARRDIRYWRTRQATAELAPVPSGETVAIGTMVTFRLNDTERRLTIVGDDEASPAETLIAFSAPLARASSKLLALLRRTIPSAAATGRGERLLCWRFPLALT